MDDTIEKGRNITDDAFQGPNMETLPDEIMLMITKKLDPASAVNFERTSKRNLRVTRDHKSAEEICKDMVYSPDIANYCDNPYTNEAKWCKEYGNLCDKVIFKSDQLIPAFDQGDGVYRIRDGVKRIYKHAFFDNYDIREVIIPNSVTEIGAGAFQQCWNLLRVSLPNSVTKIGAAAFHQCWNLLRVSLPNSLTSLEYAIFEKCTSLEKITVPKSVTVIEDCAFKDCENLVSVTIPNSVKSIGKYAFQWCKSLSAITLPIWITDLKDSVFYGCKSLEKITVPEMVFEINDRVFKDCENLVSVTIPRMVDTIHKQAFQGCTKLDDATRKRLAEFKQAAGQDSNYPFFHYRGVGIRDRRRYRRFLWPIYRARIRDKYSV